VVIKCFTPLCCLACILKMEATCSSETSVDIERTTRHVWTSDTAPLILYVSVFGFGFICLLESVVIIRFGIFWSSVRYPK
jgi:hypothetical protein